jgi:hypothetical protein
MRRPLRCIHIHAELTTDAVTNHSARVLQSMCRNLDATGIHYRCDMWLTMEFEPGT